MGTMNLVEDALTILSNYHGGHRLMRARMGGYTGPVGSQRRSIVVSDNAMRVTLSRLKKRGLVENKSGKWRITQKGQVYLEKIRGRFHWPLHALKQPRKPKNMVTLFDIPERERYKRAWLRVELTRLGFIALQKSAWFGPTPLPKEFINSLHQLQLLPHLKFFKATEADVV